MTRMLFVTHIRPTFRVDGGLLDSEEINTQPRYFIAIIHPLNANCFYSLIHEDCEWKVIFLKLEL